MPLHNLKLQNKETRKLASAGVPGCLTAITIKLSVLLKVAAVFSPLAHLSNMSFPSSAQNLRLEGTTLHADCPSHTSLDLASCIAAQREYPYLYRSDNGKNLNNSDCAKDLTLVFQDSTLR